MSLSEDAQTVKRIMKLAGELPKDKFSKKDYETSRSIINDYLESNLVPNEIAFEGLAKIISKLKKEGVNASELSDHPKIEEYLKSLKKGKHYSDDLDEVRKIIKKVINEEFDQPLNVDEILDSYLKAALWAEGGDANPELDTKSIIDIDETSREEAIGDITRFLAKAKELAPEELSTLSASEIGHNLWLSRNGHGAGFFDDYNDKLQDIAKNMKEKIVEVGDDGKVYIR